MIYTSASEMLSSRYQAGCRTEYDHVVVGSGFTALAYIEEMLHLQSTCKILCIERGNGDFHSHYERLARLAQEQGQSRARFPNVAPDEFPLMLSRTMTSSDELADCAGMAFLLGGRSRYWYGWCM